MRKIQRFLKVSMTNLDKTEVGLIYDWSEIYFSYWWILCRKSLSYVFTII